jgi:hypothetical protein
MQFIPSSTNFAAKMKALLEQRQCLPLSAIVCLFLPDENLDLLSDQAADRGRSASGKHYGLPYGLPWKADSKVLLGRIS